MSKVSKIIIIVSLSCLFIGLILCAIGFGLGARNGFYLDRDGLHFLDDKNVVTEEIVLDDISNIEMNLSVAHVHVKLVSGEENKLVYTYPKDEFKYDKEKDTIYLFDDTHKWNFFNFNFFGLSQQREVILYYKDEFLFDKINISLEAGDLEIDKAYVNELEINLNLGALFIKNSNIKYLKTNLNSGNLEIENTITQKAKLDLDLGNLTTNQYESHDLNFNVSVGNADLEGTFLGDTKGECSFGDIHLITDQRKEDYEYQFDVDLGSLHINGKKSTETDFQHPQVEHTLKLKVSAGNLDVTFAS